MIEIIFLDVDGCMTDGGIYKTNDGNEFKKFDVKDGFAIEQWNKFGKITAIITGKISKIVENRARELGIKYCYQGVKDKFSKATEILNLENLQWENSAAIGDDLNDMKLLANVGLSFVPVDAYYLLKPDIILKQKGGKGAVREMIEIIINNSDLKDDWLKNWL